MLHSMMHIVRWGLLAAALIFSSTPAFADQAFCFGSSWSWPMKPLNLSMPGWVKAQEDGFDLVPKGGVSEVSVIGYATPKNAVLPKDVGEWTQFMEARWMSTQPNDCGLPPKVETDTVIMSSGTGTYIVYFYSEPVKKWTKVLAFGDDGENFLTFVMSGRDDEVRSSFVTFTNMLNRRGWVAR